MLKFYHDYLNTDAAWRTSNRNRNSNSSIFFSLDSNKFLKFYCIHKKIGLRTIWKMHISNMKSKTANNIMILYHCCRSSAAGSYVMIHCLSIISFIWHQKWKARHSFTSLHIFTAQTPLFCEMCWFEISEVL